MCTIKLNTIMRSDDFVASGGLLFNKMKAAIENADRVVVDMEDVTSLPSMFLNVSFGKFIDEYVVDRLTKQQPERISDYIEKYITR